MNESGDKSESKRACSIWVDSQRIVSIGHERKALEKLLWGFDIQYLESESGAQLELCEDSKFGNSVAVILRPFLQRGKFS
jgi:hypothetical protein